MTSVGFKWSEATLNEFALAVGLDAELAALYAKVLAWNRSQGANCDVNNILELVIRHISSEGDCAESVPRQRHVATIALRQLADRGQVSSAERDEIHAFLARHALALPEFLDVRLPNRAVLRCYMNEYVQIMLWLEGTYEPVEAFLLDSLLCPGMSYFDVGANIGQHTVVLGRSPRFNGHIHAFEAVPLNHQRLVENVDRNGLTKNCTTTNCALWDRQEYLDLALPLEFQGWCPNHGGFHLRKPTVGTAGSVWARDLDSYCEELRIPKIDLLKLDVEGSEFRVLSGALQILENGSPKILMESNPAALGRVGSSVEELSTLICKLGFRIMKIGNSAIQCCELSTLPRFEIVNVLLYRDETPAIFDSHWNYSTIERWLNS